MISQTKTFAEFINEEVSINEKLIITGSNPNVEWKNFALKPSQKDISVFNVEGEVSDTKLNIDLLMSDNKRILFTRKSWDYKEDLHVTTGKNTYVINGPYFTKIYDRLGLTGSIVTCLIGLFYKDWTPTLKNVKWEQLDMSKVTITF